MDTIVFICQLIVGLGLLNVWLLRFNKPTRYRGGNAASMPEEFATYGLPGWFCYLVGFLKLTAALGLLTGLMVPPLVFPSAVLVAALMVGAVAMHLKVKDPALKSLPALSVLVLSLVIIAGRTPH
jgi:uncharacterized membrane protein YphA (DoxX/SURF4 family)